MHHTLERQPSKTITDLKATSLIRSPPDGVDLHAFEPGGNKLTSPEVCSRMYRDAFEAAGGIPALQAVAGLSRRLRDELGEDERVVTQPKAWESHNLECMLEKLGKDSKTGADSGVRAFGIRCLKDFEQRVQARASHKVELTVGAVKKWERASVKTRIKYGLNCSRLVDMNRVTVECVDIHDMYAVAEQLFEDWGPRARRESMRVVEFEDHYLDPMPGDYRHLQMLVMLAGSCWEVQINTLPMVKAKHEAGHRLYKTTRFVREMLLFAAMDSSVDSLHELLSFEGIQDIADPNAVRDSNGMTALHHAAFNGKLEVMDVLRDSKKITCPADVWALDSTEGKYLPLNYAATMHYWPVVGRLAEEMLRELPSEGGVMALEERKGLEADAARCSEQRICQRIAQACACVVDFGEDVLGLLVQLSELWRKAGGDKKIVLSPVGYAFKARAAWALKVLVDAGEASLWEVDLDMNLPIEKAIELALALEGKQPDAARVMRSVAATMTERMKETKPTRPSADAAWSLQKCRGSEIEGLEELVSMASDKVGRRIFTCGEKILKEYDALTLTLLSDCNLEESCTCLVASAPKREDPGTLYAGTAHGSIFRWPLRARDETRPLESSKSDRQLEVVKAHAQAITCMKLWPPTDSKFLHTASNDNTVKIWTFTDRSIHLKMVVELSFKHDVHAISRIEDSLYAATQDKVMFFDISSDSLRRSKESPIGRPMKGHKGMVEALLANTVGRKIISGGRLGEIMVWNMDGSHNTNWTGHDSTYRVVGLSADRGTTFSIAVRNVDSLVPGDESMHVRIRRGKVFSGPSQIRAWSSEGELQGTWSEANLDACLCGDIWSLKGILVVASASGVLHVWNGDTGAKLADKKTHSTLTAFTVTGPAPVDIGDDTDIPSLPAKGEADATPGTGRPSLRRANSNLLKSAFHYFDRDGNGRLSRSELRAMLNGGNVGDSLADLLLHYVDEDQDGTIAFDEFVDFIHSAPFRPFDGELAAAGRSASTSFAGLTTSVSMDSIRPPVAPSAAKEAALAATPVTFDGGMLGSSGSAPTMRTGMKAKKPKGARAPSPGAAITRGVSPGSRPSTRG